MPWEIYVSYLLALSLITFICYLLDKRKAKKGAWRIPEKVLLLLSFLGGSAGGYLAMQVCRHKTKKWYFHAVNLLGLAWQITLLFFLI